MQEGVVHDVRFRTRWLRFMLDAISPRDRRRDDDRMSFSYMGKVQPSVEVSIYYVPSERWWYATILCIWQI